MGGAPVVRTRKKGKGVVLRPRRTRFVELFRTTPPKTVCPNFYVLSHANGCAFQPHCEYCYLKSSLWHIEGSHVFTNTDRMFREIREWIRRDGLETHILNMGNLSDSLVFEPVRPLVLELVELFRAEAEALGRPHSILLVTKGGLADCAPLLAARPCANVIVSFSLNNPAAARRHEPGAAPVSSRLAAARRLRDKGWRVRIRIDPMLRGFTYGHLSRKVRELRPERVTLGSLRAETNLKRCVPSALFEHLEPAVDPKGLARYPFAERLAMYKSAANALGNVCPIGLCEEPPEMWDALGFDREGRTCNCGG